MYTLYFATNIVREIYPALALAEHLTFDVSEYNKMHPDIFEISGRGVFINNNPGASILGAVPDVLTSPIIDLVVQRVHRARAVSPDAVPKYDTRFPLVQDFYRKATERGVDVKLGLAAAVMQGFLMAPLSSLSAVLMFNILFGLTRSVQSALLLALLFAFATPVFYRTAQLNQNLLVAHFALFAFAALWRPWDKEPRLQGRHYLLAGVLGGWTVVLDYSGMVVVLALSLYAFVFRKNTAPWATTGSIRLGNLLWFGTGLSCAVAVLLAYQWVAFGHPLYPAQTYMPPADYSHLGYRGMDWPKLDLLWNTAFSIRYGLFTSAPILVLSLYFPGWFRSQRLLNRPELYFVLTFAFGFFLFCSANQYGRMQFNSGVRHVVAVTPFLFLIVAGVLLRMPRLAAAIIGVLSTYWSWCLTMYRDVEHGLGVFESIIHISIEGFRFPWLTTLTKMGYFPESSSAIPLLVIIGAVLWVVWNVPAAKNAK